MAGSCLVAQGAWQAAEHHPVWRRQQQRFRCLNGCRHCIECAGLRSHRHSATGLRSSGGSAPPAGAAAAAPDEWWPSGLSSPAIYFHVRRRQLHLQYREAATAEGLAKLWRDPEETRTAACALLAARRARPLGLLIPKLYTNIQQAEGAVEVVGSRAVPLGALTRYRAVAAPAVVIAAAAAAAPPAARPDLLLCCSEELPRRLTQPGARAAALAASVVAAPDAAPPAAKRGGHAVPLAPAAFLSSPAKRTRLAAPPAAPAPRPQQQQAAATMGPPPWWMQAPAEPPAQQQQQQVVMAAHAVPGSAASPAPPSLLSTPGLHPLSACQPPLSSGSFQGSLGSGGSLRLAGAASGPLTATSVLASAAQLAGTPPAEPLPACQQQQQQQQLLQYQRKLQRALACPEVVVELHPEGGEPGDQQAPSLMSTLYRLAGVLGLAGSPKPRV